jgi:hypothetical protein
MNHLHRRVIGAGIVAAALIGGAYALLGIGFAVMIGVGVFGLYAIVLAGLIVFEEESHLPWWNEDRGEQDHGYHPAR